MANLGYLIHHLATALDRQSDMALQTAYGIGFSQFKILMALHWQEGVRQRQIAERLGQTEASISRQIKSLQDRGFVGIRANPDNRREHIAVLTAKGDRLMDKAMQLLNEHHAPVFARLTPHEQAKLDDMLQSMHQEACIGDKSGVCQVVTNQ